MFDVQTPSFFRILQRQNDTPGPITDNVAFTLTVTGPNIQETIGVTLTWSNTEGNPAVSLSSGTDGTAGSADGLRYLRLVYPKRTGSGEPWRVDAAAADGTKRSISINVTTSSPNVLFDNSLVIPDWEADYNTTVLQIPEPATGGGGGDDYVPITRKVNGKALSDDIELSTSDLPNDSGYITSADVPEGSTASTVTPVMDGTANKGTDNGFARGDHVHPTDTSRQAVITASGILKGNGSGGVTAAVAGTDYLASFTETDPTVPSWAKQSSKPSYTAGEVGAVPTTRKVNGKALSSDITLSASDVSALPSSTSIPSKTSDLTNDSGFITGYTETDPTVPSWAKQSSKPSYTASEVGALPDSTTIPSKTSDLTNDSGFVTSSNVPYLTCSTAADTAAKTTSLVSGSFTSADLVTGAQVLVKFTYANGASNPTLSVNGTTAKSIKRYGTTAPSTSAASSWNAGAVVLFVYDGTYWQMEAWENTTYSSMTEAEITAGTGTTARIITPARLKTAVQTWETGEVNVIDTVKVNGTALTPSSKAVDVTVPTKTSDLTNDSGFLTTETDPTVPSWAKASSKPSYTASEVGAVPTTRTVNSKALSSNITLSASDVGALPSSTTIPTKTSDLTNDSGFITSSDIPEGSAASTTTPKMDGTANVGTEMAFARGDHVHPSDTSKLGTSGNASSTTVAFTTASSRSNITTGTTLATAFGKIAKYFTDLGSLAFKSEVAKSDLASGVQTSLGLADTALQSYTETDPTVPSWAKASSKPSYTASEVGAVPTTRTVNGKALSSNITLSASDVSALPSSTTIPSTAADVGAVPTSRKVNGKALSSDITLSASDVSALPASTTIPSKTSDLTNDSGFITGYTETDPTVPSWAKASSKPSYTAAEVGAVPTSRTVNGKALSADISLTASDVGAGSATTVTTGTLTASSWSGSTYSALQTTYPAASYDIEIEPNGDSCTAAQYAAWGAAQLVGSSSTNILKALGTVPTVNIPIIIKVTAK